jgi:hypothetical protein
MSQTQAVALPTRGRTRWLASLILVTVAPAPLVTVRPDESTVAAAMAGGR